MDHKKKHKKKKTRSRSEDKYEEHKERARRKRDSSRESSSEDDSASDFSSGSSRERKHTKKKKHTSKHKHHSKSSHRSRDRPFTQEDIDKAKEERMKEKELMKALETPEEKRARRLAKKESKGRKRKEKMGWDAEYMGYTNADNPFGDEHLLETFMWRKKMQKEGTNDLSNENMEKHQKGKMMESKLELEKVKKRRLERERERDERENEREMLQREKEVEYFKEWEKQEDSFHLKQAKLRSKIRIEDARAKPIDLLAKYISAEDDDLAIELHEPYTYLNGLTITDLEDLMEDIKVYMQLEQARNAEYWRDITIIAEDELGKLRKLDPTSRDYVGERRSGINQSVLDDVGVIFKGKSLNQLQMLESSIHSKLRGGEGVDVGYWESLLQQLKAHQARTRLRERHQEQLRRKLFKLKQEQGIESAPLFPILNRDKSRSASPASPLVKQQATAEATSSIIPEAVPGTSSQSMPPPLAGTSSTELAEQNEAQMIVSEDASEQRHDDQPEDDEDDTVMTEADVNDQYYQEYDQGSYSPVLLQHDDLEPDTLVSDPLDDLKRLDYTRKQLLHTGEAKSDNDAELMKKAREGMTDDEAQFSVEVPLEKKNMLWSDKYRPRKPRFFNRVHTGFEWNKYNQTHYDIDNPPPKIVQGYKFNIFYPDLIDKSDTPQYTLTPIEDNRDFGLLKFTSGPPYEDIAFKIVNREWEYSYKRGFRCQFHNNIFQLWFHFKRYRYRR